MSGDEPRTCRCGHVSDVHAHYRRGTDCALCDCRRLRRVRGVWTSRWWPGRRNLTAVDEWLTAAHMAMVEDLASVLDIEAGLAAILRGDR